jgi:ATP-dependent Clp protease ATP-binding subunit ClpA
MGSLERYHAGLHDQKHPIGSFMLIGPTGSGKTYSVETLASNLLPKESFIRLDCSEFSLEQDVSKIFGAAPGYIGSDSPSMLARLYNDIPNKENGFILLLDEIEKANRKFFDSWLQVLDAARLTDAKGNVMDFSRCLIFMTSNVGADFYSDKTDIGFRAAGNRENIKRVEAQVSEALKKNFKPEFLNRLTGVVHYSPLSKDQQGMILNNMLGELNARLSKHYIRAEFSPEMYSHILNTGFSKEYGARELKRTLIKIIEQPLAKQIINRSVDQDSLIELGLENGGLYVRRIGDYPILMEENVASA